MAFDHYFSHFHLFWEYNFPVALYGIKAKVEYLDTFVILEIMGMALFTEHRPVLESQNKRNILYFKEIAVIKGYYYVYVYVYVLYMDNFCLLYHTILLMGSLSE